MQRADNEPPSPAHDALDPTCDGVAEDRVGLVDCLHLEPMITFDQEGRVELEHHPPARFVVGHVVADEGVPASGAHAQRSIEAHPGPSLDWPKTVLGGRQGIEDLPECAR
jgi:hypothetical protein